METTPTTSDMPTRGPKVFTTWALGANFNTKFNVVGPWALKEAKDIIKMRCRGRLLDEGSFLVYFDISKVPDHRRFLIQKYFKDCVSLLVPISIFGPMNFFTWLFASMALLNC